MTPDTSPPDYPPPQMWYGFVRWALGEKGFTDAFEQETGIKKPAPAKTVIDAMIDEATGYKLDYLKKFVIWLTKNHWGEKYAPQIYFEKFNQFPGA